MGCCGDREKGVPPEPTAKWDFINLSDFKSTSSWNTLAYLWLWIMAIVAVAVFAADTFTAVNLLAYNRWTSQVRPVIPIEYARWIFAGCILFGFVLYIFSWIMAIRIMKRGGIAESYMDPLAATLNCMRGSGWRRFLVFSSLTKSKKGADYVALFVYFSFQSAIRVIIAEGPRQVINGMTLYSVMQKKHATTTTNAPSHKRHPKQRSNSQPKAKAQSNTSSTGSPTATSQTSSTKSSTQPKPSRKSPKKQKPQSPSLNNQKQQQKKTQSQHPKNTPSPSTPPPTKTQWSSPSTPAATSCTTPSEA